MTAEKLLQHLPAFKNERVLVKKNQEVDHIIQLILDAHERYAKYYDQIAMYFDAPTTEEICSNIYSFLKDEIKYVEEGKVQTTAVPQAILHLKKGDCKHYASFAGGVLGAINRLTGKRIKWCYRFVSNDPLVRTAHHVFVVVFDHGEEIWIDPVPGAEKATPFWQIDFKV